MSLVAVAAVVASLTLARQRTEPRPPDPERMPDKAPVAVDLNLDDLRSAGF